MRAATAVALESSLQALLPRLAKAVEINRTLSLLRQRYHAALGALDHVAIGVCVVMTGGTVVVANREARRIHDLDDGLAMSAAGTWRGLTVDVSAAIANAVRLVGLTAAGQGADREDLLFAERKSGKRPFMIEVVPLRDSLAELEQNLSSAIMMIVDPDNQHDISVRRLALLFTLTEAAVCQHMIAGLSAPEIAESRGLSDSTGRAQFKSIYAKTGGNRRADLLRLAITVDPPIGGGDR